MKNKKREYKEKIYSLLVNEEDARVCKQISDEACKEVPGNFTLTLVSYFLNKLADTFANPKIILPWIMQSLHVPLVFISFLVPLRESGALLPQLFIAGYIRRLPVRKWVWVAGVLLQAISMIGIALTAMHFSGTQAGWIIIILLALFSLSRGLSSIASKDVMGKTIPKSRRGKLNGWSASLAGALGLGLGVVLLFWGKEIFLSSDYSSLLLIAGMLWLFAAFMYAKIKEDKGESEGGGNAALYALSRLKLLKEDKNLRTFILARTLFLCSVLSAPFYVLLAQKYMGNDATLLGLFVLLSGLAGLLSAPFWGHFSDLSSKKVMIFGASITSLLGFCIFAFEQFFPQILSLIWVLPVFYFFLSIAHEGIRIGRKTYIVDIAQGNKRTDYVALSNTIIGIALLFGGLFGPLAEAYGISLVILLLSILGLLGIFLALSFKEA